jgi:hypothetical protein
VCSRKDVDIFVLNFPIKCALTDTRTQSAYTMLSNPLVLTSSSFIQPVVCHGQHLQTPPRLRPYHTRLTMVPDTAVMQIVSYDPVVAAAIVYLVVGSLISLPKLDTDSKIRMGFWFLISYLWGAWLGYIIGEAFK